VTESTPGDTGFLLTGLGVDDFLMRIGPGSTSMFLTDALGSLVATTDAAGGVQSEVTYEPFGTTEMSAPAPAYRFTGREHDEPLYLYYYRARYYHTDLQRFISEDPLGLLGGDPNVFAYVGNIPTRFVDPLGLDKRRAGASQTPLVFFGIQASAFLGELFQSGTRSVGVGKEVTIGLVLDLTTGSVRSFKTVGVPDPDDPEDIVAGANLGLGLVVGLFRGTQSEFFGKATEETLTGLPPGFSFTRIETPSGKTGAAGSLNFGGSFTKIKTFTSPLFAR
jgi:RHS repeat-associated protein